MEGVYRFDAMICLVGRDSDSFPASIEVDAGTLVVYALDIEIGRWPTSEIRVELTAESVSLCVEDTVMQVTTEDDATFARLVRGPDAPAGAA